MIIVEISYWKTNETLMEVVMGLLVIERNIKGGRTTKKAKRANVCPCSWVNQPILHEKLPIKMIIKKGVVIARISIKIISQFGKGLLLILFLYNLKFSLISFTSFCSNEQNRLCNSEPCFVHYATLFLIAHMVRVKFFWIYSSLNRFYLNTKVLFKWLIEFYSVFNSWEL